MFNKIQAYWLEQAMDFRRLLQHTNHGINKNLKKEVTKKEELTAIHSNNT